MKANRKRTDDERLSIMIMVLVGTLWYTYGWMVALGVGCIVAALALLVCGMSVTRK